MIYEVSNCSVTRKSHLARSAPYGGYSVPRRYKCRGGWRVRKTANPRYEEWLDHCNKSESARTFALEAQTRCLRFSKHRFLDAEIMEPRSSKSQSLAKRALPIGKVAMRKVCKSGFKSTRTNFDQRPCLKTPFPLLKVTQLSLSTPIKAVPTTELLSSDMQPPSHAEVFKRHDKPPSCEEEGESAQISSTEEDDPSNRQASCKDVTTSSSSSKEPPAHPSAEIRSLAATRPAVPIGNVDMADDVIAPQEIPEASDAEVEDRLTVTAPYGYFSRKLSKRCGAKNFVAKLIKNNCRVFGIT